MEILVWNLQNSLINQFNENLIRNQDYNRILRNVIQEIDETLILNKIIWSPKKLSEKKPLPEQINNFQKTIDELIENSVNAMKILLKNKPKNQYDDYSFASVLDILEYYSEKMKRNEWTINSYNQILQPEKKYIEHELKAINTYLSSTLDLLIKNLSVKAAAFIDSLKNPKKNIFIKLKEQILKHSPNLPSDNEFFNKLWESDLWKVIQSTKSESNFQDNEYYPWNTFLINHCLFVLTSRIFLEIDSDLRENLEKIFG